MHIQQSPCQRRSGKITVLENVCDCEYNLASIQHTRTRLENALQKTIEIYIGKALSSVRVWWDGQKGRPAAQAVGVWRPYLSEERSVELDDVGTVTAPHHHVQVHQQLLLLLLVHRGPDPLRNQHKRPVRTGEDWGTLRNSEERR